jgi:hypothetical protein
LWQGGGCDHDRNRENEFRWHRAVVLSLRCLMLLPVRLRGRDFRRSGLRFSELQTAEDVDLPAGRDS